MSSRASVLARIGLAVVLTAGLAVSSSSPAAADPSSAGRPIAAGTLVPVGPERVLDTRVTLGRSVSSGSTVAVDLSQAVPTAKASAVLLTVTATDTRGTGFVTVFPTGTNRPTASALNFVAGRTVANQALTPVTFDGSVSVFVGGGGAAGLVVDVRGYVVAGRADVPGAVVPVQPTRLLDTREGPSGPRRVTTASVRTAGVASIPATGVAALVVNVTVVDPTGDGFLTAVPYIDPSRPVGASSLNFVAGQTVANLAVTTQSTTGLDFGVRLGPAATAAYVVVDVTGYVLAGTVTESGAVAPLDSSRILDTRDARAPLGPGETRSVQVLGLSPTYLRGPESFVVVNVTATDVTGSGYLTTWAGTEDRPLASDLNVAPGTTVAALTTVRLASDGSFRVYNGTSGTVDLVVDLSAHAPLVLAPDSADDATAYQQNARHDGVASSALGGSLTRRWAVDLGGTVSHPVVADAAAFVTVASTVGDRHSSLMAVDLATGAVRWGPAQLPTDPNATRSSGVAYAAGRVFVTAGERLLAFDARTGVRLWIADIPIQLHFTTPTAALGRVFVTGSFIGFRTFAFDQANGHLAWMSPAFDGATLSAPAVDASGVYDVYDCDVTRLALSGDVSYGADEGCGAVGANDSATVLHDGTVWNADAGSVHRASDGRTLRSFTSVVAPAFAGKGVLVLDREDTLRRETTGSSRASWAQRADGGLVTSPVVSGSTAYVGSATGTVFGIDTSTGALVWSGDAGAPILRQSVPATAPEAVSIGLAVGDGALVVPASDTLVAFG